MSDEMILVPRAELLAWAQDWLRENDPGDGTDCVTPFDWHLLKTPVEAHCTTCSCVPGMTPAVRFDITPAEKEGAVRDHLIRMGWTPPSESQEQGGGECCHSWQDYGQMNVVRCNKCEARAVSGYEDRPFTAPPSAATPLSREHGSVQEMFNPSAPVGVPVDVVREYLDARACYDPALRHPNSPEGLRLREARNALDTAIALAQQPPAEAQAQGGGEVVAWVSRNDAMFTDAGNWRCTNPLLYSSQESPSMIPLYTAPPSAPVGVEAVFNLVRACESAVRRLGWRSDDYTLGHEARMLAQDYENGAFQSARETLHALAQQPPAEAQPVGKVSKDTGLTVTLERLPYYTGTRLAKGTELYAHPPPSAPVGVERIARILQTIRRLALVIRERGTCAPLALDHIGDDLESVISALAQQTAGSAPVGVAEAWQQGYHQGVQDERTSEDNIGIAGFNAKVEPARNNPYLAQQPAADRVCPNTLQTCRCDKYAPCAAQQPAAEGEMGELVGLLDEVRSHFTRDDDLPDDLLPRIDAALRWIAGGSDNDR